MTALKAATWFPHLQATDDEGTPYCPTCDTDEGPDRPHCCYAGWGQACDVCVLSDWYISMVDRDWDGSR